MGCEKSYVSRKEIVLKCNHKQVSQSNTVNFWLIVERIFSVIFEITNDVPLQRFRQAGKWNHWVKNLSSADKENLSKYYYKLQRVPNSNMRYFNMKLLNQIEDSPSGLKKIEGSPSDPKEIIDLCSTEHNVIQWSKSVKSSTEGWNSNTTNNQSNTSTKGWKSSRVTTNGWNTSNTSTKGWNASNTHC